jgi:hypothetical protein
MARKQQRTVCFIRCPFRDVIGRQVEGASFCCKEISGPEPNATWGKDGLAVNHQS